MRVTETPDVGTGADATAPVADQPTGTRRLPDVVGMAWVIVAACAVLTPALVHGTSLGPYNFLAQFGLSKQPGVVVRGFFASDQITQMIPWTGLAWTQVHHGHLPLWNPYSALGMPLAFNWQSAPFSLPALVGYLMPLRLAYTAQVVTTLIVAGSGAYVLGRVLKMSPLASAFTGTVFELSGAVMVWLGWPIESVFSWAGWAFAAVLLVVRGDHRTRHIVFLALIVALAIYAGQPDALIQLIVALAVFSVALVIVRSIQLREAGTVLRPLVDLAVAAVAGAALAAPLVLPSLQLTSVSVRSAGGAALGGQTAYPPAVFGYLVFAGLSGQSTTGHLSYLGVIVVVLAVTAVALRRRRPEVIALVAMAAVMGAIAVAQPVENMLNSAPGLHAVRWPRAIVLMIFAICVLAGLGMDLLVRSSRDRAVRIWLGTGFLLAAVVLGALWAARSGHLAPAHVSNRAHAFIWSAGAAAVGLAGCGILPLVRRKQAAPASMDRAARVVGASFLAFVTAYLVATGGPLLSSSPSYITATPAEALLQHAVGSSLVGFGAGGCFVTELGIHQDVNVMFGVQELAVYDPLLPRAYFRSWNKLPAPHPGSPGLAALSTYCAPVTSATIARIYGVSFVLEPHGAPGPTGGVFEMRVGDEDLYRIPGSGIATLTAIPPLGGLPPAAAVGTTLPVTHPDPASWKLVTHATTPQVLRLRLTDVPGWHATIDGRPLALTSFENVMMQARIPPGTHTVELHYWPTKFTEGIAIALCSLVGLTAALVASGLRRRRTKGTPRPRVKGAHARRGRGPGVIA